MVETYVRYEKLIVKYFNCIIKSAMFRDNIKSHRKQTLTHLFSKFSELANIFPNRQPWLHPFYLNGPISRLRFRRRPTIDTDRIFAEINCIITLQFSTVSGRVRDHYAPPVSVNRVSKFGTLRNR